MSATKCRPIPRFGIALASLGGLIAMAVAPATTGAAANPASAPAARTPTWQAAIGRLFDMGNASGSASVAAARAQYERLKQVAPKDRRIDYAFALVLINQHRYADAEPLVARYLAAGKAEPGIHCTEIWALLQLRRYADAADQAVALAELFPNAMDAAPQPKLHEAAVFLGVAFGYLELARAPLVEIPGLAERKARVLEALGDTYREAFDFGRDEVAGRLAEMKAARQAEEDQRTAKTEQEKKSAQVSLEKDSSQIASHVDAIQSSAEQLQDAQRQLGQIQREFNALNEERTQLGVRIVTIQAEIQALQNPQTNGQGTANGTNARQTLRVVGPADARFAQVNALALQLAVLNKQAFDMDRKLLAYRQQATELGFKGLNEAELISRRQEAAATTERRAQAAERVLKRSEKTAATRSAALNEKMKLVSTHLPFPYAQEKKRVLAWFAK